MHQFRVGSYYEVASGVGTDAAHAVAPYGPGMTRSAAVSVVFEAVMPALGVALLLGASMLPAVAIAAALTLAVVALGARS